ncbi:MAG: hypothetical protein VKK04_13840 [Synechococcales bacterium]|nr:hypothetical protein [Synechococcales bacterium]
MVATWLRFWNKRISALTVGGLVAGGLVSWGFSPLVAQSASNFGTISLSPGSSPASVRGYTQGSMPLSAIAPQDQSGTLCVGFAESEPDHVLVLSEAIATLSLRVDSNGGDTTLLVQGPNARTIQCGDDTGSNPDASIRSQNWQPGEYKVWVGAFDAGVRYDYTLSVQGTP